MLYSTLSFPLSLSFSPCMPQLDLHSLVTLAPILALLSLALASLALELNLRLAAAAKALARLTTPSAAAASPKEAAAAPRLRPFAASAASAGRRGLSTEPPKGFHSTYHVLLEKSPVSGLFPDGGLPPGEPWDGFQFWGCRLALLDALGVVHQPTLTSAELLRGKNLSFEARLLARVLFQSWEPRTPVTLEGLLQLMLLVTARGTLALRLNIELSRGEADKGPPRSALELLARVLPSARDLAEEVIRLRRSPEAPGPEALHHDQFLLILAEQRLLSALEKG